MPESATLSTVGDAAVLAANAAAAERAQAISFELVEGGLFARVLDNDQRIDVWDGEHLLDYPRTQRGEASLYDPADFAQYVNRLATVSTTLWANPAHATITAVFDDHDATSHEGSLVPGTAGWRRHRALYLAQRDKDWTAWLDLDGKLGSQETFAEQLEDHAADVVNPDPATMLEIATTFQAHRNSSFERGTRLQNGDVQLRATSTTTASAGGKAHLEIPERFTIAVQPFLGVAPVTLQARLRWRIQDGNLRIGYARLRPDVAEREAFDRIRAEVATAVQAPMHLGQAPAPVRPSADRRV
jgi:uncharacterized protein YfdQ (DUF2303 family)